MNKILYVLILSDFVIISAYGLLSPIFAIFLLEKIAGSTLVVIGISEAIYLKKPVLSVPVRKQFEQIVNGSYLAKLGYGEVHKSLNKEIIEDFFEFNKGILRAEPDKCPNCGAEKKFLKKTREID